MPAALPFFKWLGGLAASALGGGSLGVAVGNFIMNYGAYVTVTAASLVYSHQQSIKLKNSLKAKGATLSVRDPLATRKIIYGRQRVGGSTIFIHCTGTSNEYAHVIVVHAGHECAEIETVILGEDEFTPSAGVVTAYNSTARIKLHLGASGDAADSDLVSESGGYWTSTDKVEGCAYSYARFKWDADQYPQGMPALSVVLKGKKLYDPRDASTAWSDNPALCIRDYLTDTLYGLGCTSDEIDDDSFSTAANVCDESVALAGGGTEKRYTCNGLIDTGTSPKANLEDLLSSCAGSLVYVGGVWRLIAGADRATSATFTLDHLRGGVSIQTADSLRDTCNAVKGIYVTEDNNWQPADFPPITNSTYRTEDNGERIWHDIDLPFTTSASMAQRLAKIVLEQSRQQITATIPLNLAGLAVTAGDIIALPFERYGWEDGGGKLFEVMSWKLVTDSTEAGPVLGVDLVVREYAAGVWDWNSGEETTVDLAPNTNLLNMRSVATPSTPTLTTSNFQQDDGTITPRLRVQWTAATDIRITSGGFVQIEYKQSADSTWLVWTSTLRGSASEDFITDVLAGESYDVLLRFVNASGVAGAYSTTATATISNDTTAPAAPTGLNAISTPGSITLDWATNTETDLAEYILERSTSSGTGFAEIWRGRSSIHTDFGAGSGTKYYRVKAVDRTNNISPASSEASSTANPATGNKIVNVFKRAASPPAAPTGNYIPSGWSDTPPAVDGNPLYYSVAEVTSTGTLVGAWSTPVRLDGADGSDGDSIYVEYSIDGSTSWHSTFTTGDYYMRIKIGAGGSWGSAIKISGEIEDGEITTVKLANGAVSQISAVQASTASGLTNWSYTEIAAITVNADEAQDVVLQAGFGYADDGAAYTDDFTVRILRDGTPIFTAEQTVRQGNTDFVFFGVTDPDLASGVTEYSLEIRPQGGGGTATPSAREPYLCATILKDRLN